MNIFVVGTGRCSTVTFNKACSHIINYTSSHETNTSGLLGNNFIYPDNHIEIDPRMSYFLPLLKNKYPNSFWVHLQRERNSCITSLSRRRSLIKYGCFHLGTNTDNLKLLSEIYYDNTNELIKKLLADENHIHLWTHELEDSFDIFYNKINAKGDILECKKELKIKYNKS